MNFLLDILFSLVSETLNGLVLSIVTAPITLLLELFTSLIQPTA